MASLGLLMGFSLLFLYPSLTPFLVATNETRKTLIKDFVWETKNECHRCDTLTAGPDGEQPVAEHIIINSKSREENEGQPADV